MAVYEVNWQKNMKPLLGYLFILFHSILTTKAEISMGTTILAIRYRDGVVVGADSRTSVSGYVSNRFATKISFVLERNEFEISPPSFIQKQSRFWKSNEWKEIDDRIAAADNDNSKGSTCCICRSGSAADTQYIADMVRHQLLKRRLVHHTSSSISEVANLIKNYLNSDGLSASLICAGYDHVSNEGCIYSIDLGGTIMEQPMWACNGSGSGYILGYIDEHYRTENGRPIMTEQEAVAFVGNAIELAMDRDGSSGGVVRMYVIDKNGKKSILRVPSKYSTDVSNQILSKFAPAKPQS
jgi:20S proteasome subunit beta 1